MQYPLTLYLDLYHKTLGSLQLASYGYNGFSRANVDERNLLQEETWTPSSTRIQRRFFFDRIQSLDTSMATRPPLRFGEKK